MWIVSPTAPGAAAPPAVHRRRIGTTRVDPRPGGCTTGRGPRRGSRRDRTTGYRRRQDTAGGVVSARDLSTRVAELEVVAWRLATLSREPAFPAEPFGPTRLLERVSALEERVRSSPRSSSGPVCSGTPEPTFPPSALWLPTVAVTARSVPFWAVRLMRDARATWILAPRREALIRRLNWSLCRRGATANPALQHVSTCCRFALRAWWRPTIQGSSSSDDQAGQPASDRGDRCCISRGGAGPRRLRCGDPAGRRGPVGRRDHLPRDQRHLQSLPGAVGGRERGVRQPRPRRTHGRRVRLHQPEREQRVGRHHPAVGRVRRAQLDRRGPGHPCRWVRSASSAPAVSLRQHPRRRRPDLHPTGRTRPLPLRQHPRRRRPTCTPPGEPDPCPYDSTLDADDPTCTPPVEPDPCPYDSTLDADDPTCTPPVEPDPCPYDSTLDADDPTCTPLVGSETAGPPATDPPDDPGVPSGPLPSAAPTSAPHEVAAQAVAAEALPRTGRELAPLTAAAVVLVLLGGGILVIQSASRSAGRRGAHYSS